MKEQGTQTEAVNMIDCSQQTEKDLPGMVESLQKKNKEMQETIFGISMIEGNDNATKFFTGLPNCNVFLHLFMFLSPYVAPGRAIPFHAELFLVLVKLKLNLLTGDLAHRCGFSIGLLLKIFQISLDVMFVRLSFLITWPSREVLKQNMPQVFRVLGVDRSQTRT